MLSDNDLKKIGKVVETKITDAIQELVVPAMDDLEKEMNKGFDKVNSKLDNLEGRLDTHAIQLDSHEKRLKKLEAKRVVA